MRLRKSIKVAPGVKLNISKSGVSGTFGGKGASLNLGKNGAHLNAGVPGTGIYNRYKLGGASDPASGDPSAVNIAEVGKTGRRVLTIIGILILIGALILLFTGHWFLAIIVGGFSLGVFFYPAMSALANQPEEPPQAEPPAEVK